MKKLVIKGKKKLSGVVTVSGSKNVALKAIVAACLTKDEVIIENVPLISDLYIMIDIVGWIGGKVEVKGHKLSIKVEDIRNTTIPLEIGAKIRTSSMFIAPLLARAGKALIPNPGGCRIGARPIDRHIEGLKKLNVKVQYERKDGYFHASTDGLSGASYRFEKNTHTGTETMILASVLAHGRTVLDNTALESEVDELIKLLLKMGAKIRRNGRKIIIDGVKRLNGTTFSIVPDANEVVTLAIASSLTGGNLFIRNADLKAINAFLEKFSEAGGTFNESEKGIRFYFKNGIKPVNATTGPFPGFKTDWQSPWAVLMTQADGKSTIHETVYEDRFGYVKELSKMGAKIKLYNPKVGSPENIYNFNYNNKQSSEYKHAIKIKGPTPLHNAVVSISDLRAGATLVLSALIAQGETVIYGVESLERGYESFDERLRALGADIKVVIE